ncbi:MAG: mini-circle protein [Frankiales bacterium]|nr:mini-circle protein [Frankiales bacterium]
MTRPEPPLSAAEAETLVGFLGYQRATLAWKCSNLSTEQLATRLPTSALSLGGLLKHLARIEDYWFSHTIGEQPELEPWASMPWAAEWDNHVEHTGDELFAMWMSRVEASVLVVRAALEQGLDRVYPAWGGEGEASLRWVITHMIEEYARHNGHADLLRESIDGETGE